MKVLFVDDEPLILQAMKRTLRSYRSEWEMEFVESGEEALERLAAVKFDVVISDMRMPGMNGAELLTRVHDEYPNTIRIVLSGHSEVEYVMAAMGVSHQYLSKPCNAGEVAETIERAVFVRGILESEHLKQLVSGIEHLPSLPETYQELTEVLKHVDSSVVDAARVVDKDVAMMTNLLKTVNSAYFGRPTKVESVERAVSFLGLELLVNMVLGHGLFKSVEDPHLPGLNLNRLWTHSFEVAALCRELVKKESSLGYSADEAYLAGILHDIGKVVLASEKTEDYRAVLERHQEIGGPLKKIEKEFLGAHHGEIGGYLAGIWGFPMPIVEAIIFHEEPCNASGNALSLAGVVHVADRISKMAPGASPEDAGMDMLWLKAAGLEGKWDELVGLRNEEEAETA